MKLNDVVLCKHSRYSECIHYNYLAYIAMGVSYQPPDGYPQPPCLFCDYLNVDESYFTTVDDN